MRLPSALVLACLGTVAVMASGCGSGGSGDGSSASIASAGGGRLDVVATTTQLADVTRAVGGTAVNVVQLLKANTDPHEFEPRPNDVRQTAGAQLVLLSGDRLDAWMDDVIKQSGTSARTIDVGATVPDRQPGESSGPEASKYDPHWWHDPVNVEAAVATIRDALSKAQPAASRTFKTNAASYLAKLRALDRGIASCIGKVPATQRKLVTDHDAFGYFAARYGIKVVGAVIPSQTTEAQPSAKSIAALASTIKAQGVKAVFPESSINAKLAQAIARETGATATGVLYGDTLGPKGSAGATYLTMEQANAAAMVDGFTGTHAGCAINGI